MERKGCVLFIQLFIVCIYLCVSTYIFIYITGTGAGVGAQEINRGQLQPQPHISAFVIVDIHYLDAMI